jgi:hypothetical protein
LNALLKTHIPEMISRHEIQTQPEYIQKTTTQGVGSDLKYPAQKDHQSNQTAALFSRSPDLSDTSPLLRELFVAALPTSAVTPPDVLKDMQHSRFYYVRRQYEAFARQVRQMVQTHQECTGKQCRCEERLQRWKDKLKEKITADIEGPDGPEAAQGWDSKNRRVFLNKVDIGGGVKEEDLKGQVYIVERGVKGTVAASIGPHARSKTMTAWM